MNLGEYFGIGEPALQVRTDEDGNTVASATIQAVVLWKEDIKNYIMDEIIKMCKEHGITDLYVLNRDFILSAIREKMERRPIHEHDAGRSNQASESAKGQM